ncbi:MAG: hypothetical protein ACP5RT_01220 [Candidatus Micrarchaeia archaeon]
MVNKNPGKGKNNIILYSILVIILLILALVSTLLNQVKSPQQRCASIILPQEKASCFTSLAITTNNASVCENLNGSYLSSCYQILAYNTNSPNLCKNLLSLQPSSGINCIKHFANLTGNATLCNLLPSADSQSCFFSAALTSNNKSLCNFVGANSSLCFSSLSFSNAIKYENLSSCNNVSQSTNTSFIYSLLSFSKNELNLTLSSFASSFISYGYKINAKDLCVIDVASELRNTSICSKLDSFMANQLCLRVVSPPSAISNYINYTALLDSCANSGAFANICRESILISEAVATKNISICKSMNQSSSWNCFSSLAHATGNTSYCGYISNATINSACLFEIKYNVTDQTT